MRKRIFRFTLVLFAVGAGLVGCRSPGLGAQVEASVAPMVFGDNLAWEDGDRLGPQVETGRAFAGGGPSAGCTSCQ